MRNISTSSLHHANRIHLKYKKKEVGKFSSSSLSEYIHSIVSCSRLKVNLKENATKETKDYRFFEVLFHFSISKILSALCVAIDMKKWSESFSLCMTHIGCDSVIFGAQGSFSSETFMQLDTNRK